MYKLLKYFAKSSVGSFGSMFLGVLTTKILAVTLGPAGVGIYSILRNLWQTGITIGTLGGTPALVQGISSKNGKERDNYLISSFWLFFLGSLLTAGTLVVMAPMLAHFIFNSTDQYTVDLVRWTALPVFISSLFAYFTGILNSFRAIGRLSTIQIVVAAFGLLLIYPISKLVSSGSTIAFIWQLSIPTLIGTILSLWMAWKEGWISSLIKKMKPMIEKDSFSHFIKIAGGTFIIAALSMIVLLVIRTMIVDIDGMAGAGIFDAAWTVSTVYIMLFANSLTTYFFPEMSGTIDPDHSTQLINNTIRLLIIIMVPMIMLLIQIKPLFLSLFYSHEFSGASDIMRWLLIGDYLKVTCWILGMTIIARAHMKAFIANNTVFWLAFLGLCLIFIRSTEDIGIIYLILYSINLIFLIGYLYYFMKIKIEKRILILWSMGLILILSVSWTSWQNTSVNWPILCLSGLILTVFLFLNLKKNEFKTMIAKINAKMQKI